MSKFVRSQILSRKAELEVIIRANNIKGNSEGLENSATSNESVDSFSNFLCVNKIDSKRQELLSLEAANALISKLRAQLEPFRIVADESSPWEEKSAALRLSNKLDKYKRNKLWRKRKRKRVAEKLAMVLTLKTFTFFFCFNLASECIFTGIFKTLLISRRESDFSKLIKRLMNGELER